MKDGGGRDMNDDLILAMADLDEEKVLDLVKEKTGRGQTALEINGLTYD
jgi:hypothetical protein